MPPGQHGLTARVWAAIMVTTVAVFLVLSIAFYQRAFSPHVDVVLTSDRSGLMMEKGAEVKMRGVEIGRVGSVRTDGRQAVSITLELNRDRVQYIPANVEAEIAASTAFGAKHVELIPPDAPVSQRLSSNTVLQSRNVGTDLNTVFENLVELLDHVDPAKLNAVITTLAEGLGGRGELIGETVSASNAVLAQLNAREETIRSDIRAFAGFASAYGDAGQSLIATLDNVSVTAETLTQHASALDGLLLNAIGLGEAGTELIAGNRDNLVDGINQLRPTAQLLAKYDPSYTCLLTGAKTILDKGIYDTFGGDGRTLVVDAAILLANDPYEYPQHLPRIAAKGGPGGKPGCGSLPDVALNFPVRQLITDTGWGTGIDVRPNPGLGHPCLVNFFPVTRGNPQPSTLRCDGPPSPGLPTPPPGPLPAGLTDAARGPGNP